MVFCRVGPRHRQAGCKPVDFSMKPIEGTAGQAEAHPAALGHV
jgi:hypothetical protein